jgi:hypothetical protein
LGLLSGTYVLQAGLKLSKTDENFIFQRNNLSFEKISMQKLQVRFNTQSHHFQDRKIRPLSWTIHSKAEWLETKIRISTTMGSKTKDSGSNRIYIKYQVIWKMFEPAAEVLKTCIFRTKIGDRRTYRWTGGPNQHI